MLVLTRQPLPTLCREKYAAPAVSRGAYILADADGDPEVLLLGTGSEVSICLAAHDQLSAEGITSRVVSMPCWELFDQQDQQYQDEELPPGVGARVAVEAGIRQGWDAYLGPGGRFVGMAGFGASAPASALYEHFGITAENVVSQARELIGR